MLLAINIIMICLQVYILLDDFKNFRIRNESIIAVMGVILIKFILIGLPSDFSMRVAIALLVFLILLILYWRGYLGGGDVKLFPLAFIWLGTGEWLLFYSILTAATLIYAALALMKIFPSDLKNGKPRMAYGPCISIAWIISILWVGVDG